jgi:hypothetical protein
MTIQKVCTLLIALFFAATAWSQVQSPPKFSHSIHEWINNYATYHTVSGTSIHMGKDKFIAGTITAGINNSNDDFLYVLDSVFQPKFGYYLNSGPNWTYHNIAAQSAVIDANRIVWYAFELNDSIHMSRLTEIGTVINQFKFANARLLGLKADTLGKVFCFFQYSGLISMARFSSAGALDFVKNLNIPHVPLTSQLVEHEPDGRFYIREGINIWHVVDQDGNAIKKITAPAGYSLGSVYPDHSMNVIGVQNGQFKVARMDSSMNPLWTRQFRVRAYTSLQDSIIIRYESTVIPHTHEIILIAEVRDPISMNSSCWPGGFWELRAFVIGADGSLRTREDYVGHTSHRFFDISTSCYGEPLLASMEYDCFGPAFHTSMLHLFQMEPRWHTPECAPFNMSFHNPTTFMIGSGTISAPSIPSNATLTQLPDVVPFAITSTGFRRWTNCYKPCARLYDSQIIGPLQVQFQDSSYGYHSLKYDFGDGTFGNTPDPIHTYSSPGNYTVSIIVENECGADTMIIPTNPCPQVAMTGPNLVCAGIPSIFSQTTSFPADSIEWWVNGITQGTGNTFAFTPPATGTYQIAIVSHDFPCLDTTYQTVTAYAGLPIPNFSMASGSGSTVNFTNLSTNGVTYLWDFGDGTTSTQANPSHSYSTSGTFNVCLTATNGCGIADTCYIWTCPFPTANFNVTTSGRNISLQDLSVNAATITWIMGNGDTLTGPQTAYTYPSSGTYSICQVVSSGCATHTFCRTVTVIGNDAFFRIDYSAPAYNNGPVVAIATNHHGFTCVVGRTNSNGPFLAMVDSTTTILWYKGFFLGNLYDLRDVIAMPNGNFLIVGTTGQSGGPGSNNAFWVEMNIAGTFLNGQIIGTNAAEDWNTVKRARDGGYLLTGTAGTGGFYAKVNSALQIVWSRSITTHRPWAMFQAPDNTYWLVTYTSASNSSRLRYVHLDANGIEFEEYTSQFLLQGAAPNSSGVNYAMEMSCDGTIYIVGHVQDNVSGVGNHMKFVVQQFNTVTETGSNATYRFGGGANGSAPLYDVNIRDLIIRDNGHLLALGWIYRRNDFTTAPRTEKLLIDVNPDNMAIATQVYGATFGSNDDYYNAVSKHLNGAVIAATSLGSNFSLHKFNVGNECQLPISTLTTPNGFNEGGTPTTSQAITVPSTAYGTIASIGTGFDVQVPTRLQRCLTPCAGTVTASFTFSISAGVATIVSTSTPGASLSWSLPGTCAYGDTITVPAPCGTTIPVTLTATNGCGTSTVSQTIISSGQATFAGIGPDQTVCPGTTATFDAGLGFAAYAWSNGATTSAISVTAPGTYTVTVTDGAGCVATDTAVLNNHTPPPVSIGTNQTVCPGASATFTATPGLSSYLWNTGATTTSITVNTPGTFTVTVTDANGCTNTASAQLNHHTVANLTLGSNQTVCPGTSVNFTASLGFNTFQWSTGSTLGFITVSAPGTYACTATDLNGCSDTSSVMLSNHPSPTPAITPSTQTVCTGASATFTATAGFNAYAWSNGATTAAITVTAPGTYTVTVTDANGCTATASATLGNLAPPVFTLGPDTSFCPDTIWLLTGPVGASAYLWSTGATSSSISPTAAGTYWLQITDAAGCTSADTMALSLSPDCVWPGDANHDGVADNQDLLAIGFAYGFTGPTRPNASPSWFGQPAPDWTTALPGPINHKHPDCDGNGTIDFPDTTLIVGNYGLTHNKATDITSGPPLWILPEQDSFPAGDTVFFTIQWGDALTDVVDAHGLAFTFHIDPQQITPGTIYGRFPTSFLGSGMPDLMTLTYPAGGGDWHMGITRKDRIGRTGAGAIMRVGFLPDSVYPLTATLGYVPVQLLAATALDNDFAPFTLSLLGDSILIYNPINAQSPAWPLTTCTLHPVPTADQALLTLHLASMSRVEVDLVDMHGRELLDLLPGSVLSTGRHEIPIPTTELSEAMYFVRVRTDGGMLMKKLIVER